MGAVRGSVVMREPTIADAEAAARCQLSCWQEAYENLVSPERLARLVGDVDARIERWHQILAGSAVTRLADDGGTIVGFACVRHPPDVAPPAELSALYTRRTHWSTGLGHRLLAAALGDDGAHLWVFRDNERAVRFYRAHGFVPDGREQDEPHFGGVEIGMARPPQG